MNNKRNKKYISDREQEILLLWNQGMSTKQIAEQLCIAHKTVSSHLLHIRNKLGVATTREAVSKAMELGLLPIPSQFASNEIRLTNSKGKITTPDLDSELNQSFDAKEAGEIDQEFPKNPQSMIEMAMRCFWEDIDETLDLFIMAAMIERSRIPEDSIITYNPTLAFLRNFTFNYRYIAHAIGTYDPKAWIRLESEDRSWIDMVLNDVSFLKTAKRLQIIDSCRLLRLKLVKFSEFTSIPDTDDEAIYDWNIDVEIGGRIQSRIDIQGIFSLIEGLLFPDSDDPYFPSAQKDFELVLARSWNQQSRGDLPSSFSKALRLLALCHLAKEVVDAFRPGEEAGFFMAWADYANRLFRWKKEFKRSTRWIAVFPTFPVYEKVRNRREIPHTDKEAVDILSKLCPLIQHYKLWKHERNTDTTN